MGPTNMMINPFATLHVQHTLRRPLASSSVCHASMPMCRCRYEVMSTDEGLLAEMDMVLVGIDRPCYGGSNPHPTRSDL